MDIQGVNLSSFLTAAIMATSILFFCSSKTENGRVVTISRPLLITQARKTPAFFLYQQAQKLESKIEITLAGSTTYLNTESALPTLHALALTEMKFDRTEISSVQDAGFQMASYRASVAQTPLAEIGFDNAFSETSTAVVQPNSSPMQKWGTIRGKFEVKDGVGVVDHLVDVKRIEEGQVREMGHVDLKAGTYSIDIENPQGYLIAQIKDRSGLLIGEDKQKIINLASHGNYFEGPYIRVGLPPQIGANPQIPNQTQGQVIASNARGRAGSGSAKPAQAREQVSTIVASLFSNQHQLEKSQDKFNNISKNSSTIALIEDQKNVYAKIISIRQTADEIQTPLFTKRWVQGTLNYISDHLKLEFKSKLPPVLIGRVFVDGKPLSGARVQLENQAGVNAIYLDQFMIPNFKQEGTSENGYFMFVGLEAGNYSAVAFQNNKIIGHQVFVSEPEQISYQHILTTAIPRSVVVRVFDALSGKPVDADVIAPDAEDVLDVQRGIANYKTQTALGISNYIVRPKQSYMPINYIQDSRMDHVHIPAINEAWLTTTQSNAQINDQSNTGTIIGFVPDLQYDMFIISETYDRNQIIYFDQLGQVVTQPTTGGGFILFNVPVGAQEVVVQEKKTERIFSQVHLVKSNQTSVSHFSE